MSIKSKREFFDHHAPDWDRLYEPEALARLSQLIADLPFGSARRVLDVGCGTGVLWPLLRGRLSTNGTLAAIDLSYEMLSQASAKREADVLAIHADAHWLPFASETFELVICFATFPHLGNQDAAMGEMGRVLRQGGELWIIHLMSREEIARHHRSAGPEVQHDTLPDHYSMEQMMESAGIEPIEIVDVPSRYVARGRKRKGG